MAPALDILCFGEPLIEFNQTGHDDLHYRCGFGGDVSNCAIAAARQGASSGLMTALGDDRFGRSFLDRWRWERVDHRYVQLLDHAPTGLYFVDHDQDGHHFSYRRKGSAASLFGPKQIDPNAFPKLKILHLSAISLAISTDACDAGFQIIKQARSAGAMIAFDTNLRLNLWPIERARAIVQAAASMADIVLPSLDDAAALTGLTDPEAIAKHYLQLGAGIVGLTLGSQGCLIAQRSGIEFFAPHPVEVVDATGAGDMFDGAFLAEYLRSNDAMSAGRYANAGAALSTTGFGATDPMPTRSRIEEFLQTNR